VTGTALPRADLERLVAESSVFGELPSAARAFVSDHLEPVALPGGTELLRQGEHGDSMYLVAVGRLRVTVTRDDGSQTVVAEVGRGEVVGELAVMTDEPRSATVTALRDSQVLRLTTEAFADLVAEFPDSLRPITTKVVGRLVRSFREGSPTSPVATIAVVPLSDADDVTRFAGRLDASLRALTGKSRLVTIEEAIADLGDPAAVGTDRLAAWFGAHETGVDAVVYAASPQADAWTDACVRQADLVLLVGAAREDPVPRSVEQNIEARRSSVRIRTELVLVHPAWTRDPRGTRRWLDARVVDRHHHVRVDRDTDADRVARLVLGRGTGIVLSGGGARGIASLGVLDALDAHGVPIDACGGTSIGSLIAAAVARGLPTEDIARQIRAAVIDDSPFDVTFPALSLAAGKRVTERMREAADGLDLEDTWRNVFCVSTNLTTGDVEVHRRGPGWHAIRASFSIPGVFPPMRSATGDLLVDGGLLDNLPVGIMRAEHDNITVVAVDVGRTRDMIAGSLPGDGVVSGWRLLLGRFDRGSNTDTAGLGRVLMRLTELGSERGTDRGDVYIRPAIDSFGIADFKAFDRIVDAGREAGERALEDAPFLLAPRTPERSRP
jgi:predicted acylesterase/phospholipase RssA/CRP-like cAMP-binding protein